MLSNHWVPRHWTLTADKEDTSSATLSSSSSSSSLVEHLHLGCNKESVIWMLFFFVLSSNPFAQTWIHHRVHLSIYFWSISHEFQRIEPVEAQNKSVFPFKNATVWSICAVFVMQYFAAFLTAVWEFSDAAPHSALEGHAQSIQWLTAATDGVRGGGRRQVLTDLAFLSLVQTGRRVYWPLVCSSSPLRFFFSFLFSMQSCHFLLVFLGNIDIWWLCTTTCGP